MAASCQTGNQSGTTRAEETNPSITIAAAHRPIPIRLGPGRPPGVRASSIGGHARTVRTPRARVANSNSSRARDHVVVSLVSHAGWKPPIYPASLAHQHMA
jgi:hypothetical protein